MNNRYNVKFPWLENVVSTSDNYDLCHRRLDSLFSRLKRDPKLMKGYDEVFVEQLALGIIERVPETDYDKKGAFFLPHHPVIKTELDTTKIRVVFDGSSKEGNQKFCLNDQLLEGQNTIPNIFDVLRSLDPTP